ncbi:MAG: protein kinase [Syntrophales bacterium]|nr:protein kinase [Syntrophales bacterium]
MQKPQEKTFYSKLREIYEKESKADHYESEQPIIAKILDKIEAVLKDIYELVEPIGVGGSGVVFCIRDLRLNTYRALKIPRPIHEKLIDSVKNEIEYLTKLRHENIISIHTLGEVSVGDSNYPYFVMSYIENASDLKSAISHLLNNVKHGSELGNITYWVLDKFYQIANALNFLHNNEVIHFDIKPSNILVDKNHKPILTDLGFAKRKSDDDSEIVIGFTKLYAHPDLREDYSDLSSKNRVRKKLRPKDFKYSFDIYAFGKSLLEILYLINQKFSDVVPYDYTFGYLHLAACRMLDGKNVSTIETKRINERQIHSGLEPTVFDEIWQEFNDIRDYNQIKYTCSDDIIKDFSKLITREHFNKLIPELNMFYPKVVKSSQGICAPFSERVRAIVEHPVFERLNDTRQLAFINTIYPTATHTRLEHSIGAFRNAILYVQALYNDTYNPLFRQLMDEKDIKSILLGSLLHDIGHYDERQLLFPSNDNYFSRQFLLI